MFNKNCKQIRWSITKWIKVHRPQWNFLFTKPNCEGKLAVLLLSTNFLRISFRYNGAVLWNSLWKRCRVGLVILVCSAIPRSALAIFSVAVLSPGFVFLPYLAPVFLAYCILQTGSRWSRTEPSCSLLLLLVQRLQLIPLCICCCAFGYSSWVTC